MQTVRALVMLAVAALFGLGGAYAQTPPDSAPDAPQADQTTVMCLFSMMATMELVGSRCSAGRGHDDVQAALTSSADRLEAYLRAHGATTAVVQVRQQLLSARNMQLCSGDPLRMYNLAVSKGPSFSQDITDQVLSGANHDGCF